LRITEFNIQRYGPLKESGKITLGDFNLFFGLNEKGKTLTIDALLKMLLGKKASFFNLTSRVNEMPEGFLVIREQSGDEHVLPADGTLTEIQGLSAAELCNIFVIRDSALLISEEGEFYQHITNRLTGLRTDDIKKIKQELYDLGQITPTGEYQNKTPRKLKDKVNKAIELIERIGHKIDELNAEGFSVYEEESAALSVKKKRLEKKYVAYQEVAKRELYEKTERAIKELEKSQAESKRYDPYNADQLAVWQKAESNIELLSVELNQLEHELLISKEEVKAAKRKLEEEKRLMEKIDLEERVLSENIKPITDEYERLVLKDIDNDALTAKFKVTGARIITSFVFLISLFGAIVYPRWWVFVILGLSFLTLAWFTWHNWRLLNIKKELNLISQKALFAAEKAGISLPDKLMDDLITAIGKAKQNKSVQQAVIGDSETKIAWNEKQYDKLLGTIEERKQKIGAISRTMEQIKKESGAETLDEYTAALEQLKQLRSVTNSRESILESYFGYPEADGNRFDRYLFWKNRVEELKEYADRFTELTYDQKTVNDIAGEMKEINHEQLVMEEKLAERNHELRDLEKEVNDLLHSEYATTLPCQTTLDLEEVKVRLEDWLAEQEKRKKNAGTAIEIFTAIEEEEEEKIVTLFGHGNRASEYLKEISGGRYSGLNFARENKTITVTSTDGIDLYARQLSGGAYDQLYFSIRLSLAEKLLTGEKGFFILDDPFIKSDRQRLSRQLDMLASICQSGWQVLFFSAKDEIRDALQEKITSGYVREHAMD